MDICTYNWIKDIWIPGLNLIATIIIGIFITIYLNRKTNKDKVKDLLIDTYVDYLQKFKNFVELETFNLLARVYSILLRQISNDTDFENNAKDILITRFNIILKGLDENYSPKAFDKDASFTYYTYKFAFLLSKKKYDKLLQPLEDIFVREYFMNKTLKENQINELINNVTTNDILNQLKIGFSEELFNSINNHLTTMTREIVNRDQYRCFNKYNSVLADEIDKI